MVWLKAAAAISTYAWARARPGRSRPCLRAMPLAPAQSPLHTASDAEIKNAPSRCFRLRANNCHAPSAVRDGSALLCPWFHLNSRLADAHSSPGNGGDRQGISAPRLQGAFPPSPARARTIRPLSCPGNRSYFSLSQPFLDIVRTVSRFARNVKAGPKKSLLKPCGPPSMF